MHSRVHAGEYVLLRLPSDTLKLVQIVPNTLVSIGKYGSFPCNLLIGRPYYLTFEIADKQSESDASRLRVVPASELNAEVLAEDAPSSENPAEKADDSFDIVADDGSVLLKNNRLTIDDASRQALSMEEIEQLKKAGTGSGRDIIEKILKSHTHLSEKTSFALAKYTLRKHKKYLRRFTVLPMNVSMLTEYMIAEKEASRVMELREESLGLVGSWANVHYHPDAEPALTEEGTQLGGGRWLVVDDTGGLVVASMAEKMGLLYHPDNEDEDSEDDGTEATTGAEQAASVEDKADVEMQDASKEATTNGEPQEGEEVRGNGRKRPQNRHNTNLSSTNTLTVIHANAQPNVSLLKYFSYDTNNPTATHPLHTHLKTLTWLQLIDPSADPTYDEPESVPQAELDTWKSGKRGAYYRKRRRWTRCKQIVDETREGGFDGIVIASSMNPATILKNTVHLLRGSAHIVIYSPTVEPLTEIMDLYSKDRKAAFLDHIANDTTPPEEDFPLDPRLVLAPTLQTTKIRPWQVLPGRTHPLMTWRGGAEGYLFTARRVLPVDGKVEARGKYNKKRKIG
ncbi:putative eukaryotic translation initiation factor 3, gamma subunit [Aureobasidium pullulans]|uniref:tRNA (adenine(58)-N(1))-methyltransferase non-catalytic subunit TRM6 n=1 Tax=Aureobasidium pullulans TaxID=5580 RepID=A0A4S8S9P0_AURPU|nr:putative eukaryotic translation initiation factor 3, gamma subunit [Aureobasidium pullulans]